MRRVEAFDRGGAFHAALDADRQAVTAGEYLVVSLAESGWYQATLSLSDIASGEVLR